MDKLLPQNIEAEEGVLGSIIIDPEALVRVADFLRPEDFYRDMHRTLYGFMLNLYARRIPADFITLCDELKRAEKLEEIGSAAILSLINGVPTSGNIEHYARIVERTAVCRRLIHAAGQIAALGYEQTPNALALAEQVLFSVDKRVISSGFVSIQDLMLNFVDDLEALHDRRKSIIGVPTGYSGLDALTGGLQDTDLIILAGRPSMGKSAAAMSIGYNAALAGYSVAIFSLEMGKRQLAGRLLAMDSGLNMQNIRNGWIGDDWQAVTDATGRLSALPIWINDTSGSPVASMRSQLRRLFVDSKPDLVIVDYLQLIAMPAEEGKNWHNNRVNEIGEITRGLKALAKEFNVPVLALAQLSRSVEARASKIPQLSDLRESGSIENDADIVMFINRPEYWEEREGQEITRPNEADIIVAKHRNGPIGTVTLLYLASQTRFLEMEARR